jgi:hypothetical protein
MDNVQKHNICSNMGCWRRRRRKLIERESDVTKLTSGYSPLGDIP